MLETEAVCQLAAILLLDSKHDRDFAKARDVLSYVAQIAIYLDCIADGFGVFLGALAPGDVLNRNKRAEARRLPPLRSIKLKMITKKAKTFEDSRFCFRSKLLTRGATHLNRFQII
jgi:hypothetical protein